jgi:hypothetical protein
MKTLKELHQELLRISEADYVHEVFKVLDGLNIIEALDVLETVKSKYCETFSDNPTDWFKKPESIDTTEASELYAAITKYAIYPNGNKTCTKIQAGLTTLKK